MKEQPSYILIIPGETVLAMLMAMIDVRGWLKLKMIPKITSSVSFPGGHEINIEETSAVPVEGPFRNHACVFAVIGFPESIIYDFINEVNRRVYGIASSLTPRELEVLQKRLVEGKSVKDTAAEMNVKPQAIITFMTSIRRRVQEHLFKEET